jgi:hypothetical protein
MRSLLHVPFSGRRFLVSATVISVRHRVQFTPNTEWQKIDKMAEIEINRFFEW